VPSASQFALSRLALSCLAWLVVSPAQGQSVPVALSTRRPDVEWGTLPAKESGTPKPSQARVAGEPERDDKDAKANVSVSGLKGTLNKDDVHQTMDARQRALSSCVQQTRRGSEWVGGPLKFAFRVDSEGRVIQLRQLGASLGHLGLERCITQVLQETPFPAPAGRASAEFTWGMNVEPARGAVLKVQRSRGIAASVRKHRRELWQQCELPRRARYRVTAYVSSGGQVLSAGAITKPGAADEKLDCLVDELGKLHLPKQKHLAKVQFDVR
jgi:hypothetical protein